MSPAFSSPRQAAAYMCLLAMLLFLPILVSGTGWLERKTIYPAIPWKYGSFPWVQQKIFAETGDVDVAFLGSSHIWNAIDTPFVQKKFNEHLGHDAEVFTFGWPWQGFDALYTVARDLLLKRRVRLLVINDEGGGEAPHIHSARWFRIGENSEALVGLSWQAQTRLYGSAVLGIPRQLLSLLRPNILEDPKHCKPNFWNSYYRAPNLAEQQGALCARLAYGVNPDFVEFNPRSEASAADVLVFSPDTRDSFKFTGPTMHPYQLHFARKLAQLCQERGTRLVVLHIPNLGEKKQNFIAERYHWQEILETRLDFVGIPPSKLFAGVSEVDLPKLFFEDAHFNLNGMKLFTPLITPTLLNLYASATVSP